MSTPANHAYILTEAESPLTSNMDAHRCKRLCEFCAVP